MSIPPVIGIDPSLTATGIADADGRLHVHGGDAKVGDARLEIIYGAVMDACDARPVLAVIEDLPTHAKGAGFTAQAQGVVRLALRHAGVPYAEVIPSVLKKYADGNGQATKPDMRMALYKRTGADVRSEDQVDAAWLRHMGLDHLGAAEIKLPANQRAALDKVTWP